MFEVIVILDAEVASKLALVVVLYEAPDELLANVSVLPAVEHNKFAQVHPAEPVNVIFPLLARVRLFVTVIATLCVTEDAPGIVRL